MARHDTTTSSNRLSTTTAASINTTTSGSTRSSATVKPSSPFSTDAAPPTPRRGPSMRINTDEAFNFARSVWPSPSPSPSPPPSIYLYLSTLVEAVYALRCQSSPSRQALQSKLQSESVGNPSFPHLRLFSRCLPVLGSWQLLRIRLAFRADSTSLTITCAAVDFRDSFWPTVADESEMLEHLETFTTIPGILLLPLQPLDAIHSLQLRAPSMSLRGTVA